MTMQIKNRIYGQMSLFALLMGACFVAASWLCFINTGQVFNNPTLNRTISFLFIIGLFIGIRQYRDSSTRQGFITYGQAVVTGIWISLVTGLVYCLLYDYTLFPVSGIIDQLSRYDPGNTPSDVWQQPDTRNDRTVLYGFYNTFPYRINRIIQ